MTPHSDRPNWLKLAWQWLQRPKLDLLSLPGTNKSVAGFNLIWMFDRQEKLGRLADELVSLQLDPPHVGQVYRFEEAPEAIRRFQGGETVGKVVLRVDHE